MEEVKQYTLENSLSSIVPAIDGGVVKSDIQIQPYDHESLQRAVRSIGILKPKATSNDVAVDIVDPCLFPFAFEKTKTLRRGSLSISDCVRRSGEGELAKMPSEGDCKETDPAKYPNDISWSRRFQYLPFDVRFSDRGDGSCR